MRNTLISRDSEYIIDLLTKTNHAYYLLIEKLWVNAIKYNKNNNYLILWLVWNIV